MSVLMEKFVERLNTPMDRRVAIAVLLGQMVGQAAASIVVTRKVVNALVVTAHVEISERDERIAILLEATHTLMEEASPETLAKLDGDLDYWRIIRGIDPVDPLPPFEEEFGNDVPYAQWVLTDENSTPEQIEQAQAFLDKDVNEENNE